MSSDLGDIWPTVLERLSAEAIENSTVRATRIDALEDFLECEALKRHRVGVEEYGQPLTTLTPIPTAQYLLEEVLDASVYGEKWLLEYGQAKGVGDKRVRRRDEVLELLARAARLIAEEMLEGER